MSRSRPATARWSARFTFSLAPLLVALSCTSDPGDDTGGETHFLRRCDESSDACGGKLSCLCGVCTLPCTEEATCQGFPNARCLTPSSSDVCADSAAQRRCDVSCTVDADCAALSASHRCEQGLCRAPSSSGGAGGSANAGGSAGTGGAPSCTHGDVDPSQVLFIGDSFFALTHQISASVEGLAQSAGALSAGAHYRDNSNLTGNALALGGRGIEAQYTAGAMDSSVKVVIMNGGGADALAGTCDTPDAQCPLITAAADAARELFATMAADGVAHVVYAFYPDAADAAVRARLDALRPLVQSACDTSPVPCHWIDLRSVFAGHYSDYIQADGLNPTDTGSQATAAAIWATMQQYCVAQ